MTDYKITCIRCKKPARITAEDGNLCLLCWRAVRKQKREAKIQTSLDKCFGHGNYSKKMTEKEQKIINDVMEEMARAKLNKRKVYK